MYLLRINTPMGVWQLRASHRGITEISNRLTTEPEDPNALCRAAEKQLRAYFLGTQRSFSIPLDLHGTDFQKQVWEAMRGIPYGHRVSYGDIAKEIGKPQAVRAVAQAIGRNPCLIMVPCHRVLGKDGSLTGFSAGLSLKRSLLRLENIDWKEA